jgi:hypothetical protein
MTPGRGDRTAPPAPEGHWEVRFADAASAKGWENLAQQARENTYRAWLTMRTHPKPAIETPRHHRLKAPWPTASTAAGPASSGRSR